MTDDRFIKKMQEETRANLERHRQLLESIRTPLERVMKYVRKTFDSPAFREAQIRLQQFQENFARLEADSKRLYEELRKEGWFIAPALLDLPVQEVYALKDKRGVELSAYFCNLLKRNENALLEAMTASWDTIPHYARRRAIINAATQAHKEEKYELSVPALILLIEGTLKDVVGVVRLNPQNHIRHHLARVLGPRLTARDRFMREEELFADLLIHELFGGNNKWSRNEIAHNYLPEHATEENSVRLLFLLDKIMRDWDVVPEAA